MTPYRRFLTQVCPIGLLCLLALLPACSRLSGGKSSGLPTDLKLSLALSNTKYRPGEPVTAMVTLSNATGQVINVPMLDHVTVTFSVQPEGKDEMSYVEPIFSPKEQPGESQLLQPGGKAGSTLTRTFHFTKLTLERGAYGITAIYTRNSESPIRPSQKTYTKVASFTVEGSKAFAHRYLNGLISREDAIALASAQAGVRPQGAETLLITDEAGFQKWWVNLKVGGKVRAWFVDPYFAKVWEEARPFTAADKGIEPQPAVDSKIMQGIKGQRMQKSAR